MENANVKLVTIICEPVLLATMLSLVRSLGASGFTVTDVRGEGSGEKNSGEVPDIKTKIEVVADLILAQKIMDAVAKHYFENYSLILYSTAAQVVRKEKF